ncbi:MAG TPA: valine--tRNA ligase [Bacteroidia bacterium]|jgi:valyl-tRNA synthetase|nr:valine--tRNA ligase [Bacteroidia bacterium]
MEISKIYEPKAAEEKWYKYWMEKGFFHSEPDEREPYTIVIPPPNVTGVLHMGHVLNNTIQDVLVRRARMQGKNACWVPGTDHASIATEAKVVALLKEKGISKKDLTRDEFLKYAWEWKEKYGGIIVDQIKHLGCSCDWDRLRFTMDEDLSAAVIHVFVDLHKKGYIYRGVRMVNWDPRGLTAVSDEEVIYKEIDSKLYYVRYKIEGSTDEWITIATTRPETILGDSAVCVHPDDKRYAHLKGKKVIIPMVNRSVPIIFDEYVTMEFGTGALKVTPAHDINDYNLGIKHKLDVIDILNPDGTMSKEAQFYVGEDRFKVREKIAVDLEKIGQIVKIENIKNKLGYSERTNAVIEPKLSLQWFLKMDKVSKPALDSVMNGTVKLIPDKFINTYRHWMENVHDWCISRQLWWGQRIPAYYCDGCKETIVSEKTPDACPHCKSKSLKQDEDVLDTWFSSWLWPISVFDGFKEPGNKDINYYYPTNDLVTAPEILFFWVARMIIAGYEYMGKEPFSNVYLTGIVRDKQGRKMSKSLGNSPDPLDLIAKHGADGVRVGILLCSPAGNDLPFDESLCEQGRNFANKLWNSFRLIQSWEPVDGDIGDAAIYTKWFENKLSEQIELIEKDFASYRISEALMSIYKLIYDDYCGFYLEVIKSLYVKNPPKKVYDITIGYLETLLKIAHPFMPFITEEIWHSTHERKDTNCIIAAPYPKAGKYDAALLANFELQKEYLRLVRGIRQKNNISPKIELTQVEPSPDSVGFTSGIMKLSGTVYAKANSSASTATLSFVLKDKKYVFLMPEGMEMDKGQEKERITKEIEYHKGFLKSVEAKLNNQKFAANAKPEVIQNERNKKADAEAKIGALEKQLLSLN